jgi:hypothetical protein
MRAIYLIEEGKVAEEGVPPTLVRAVSRLRDDFNVAGGGKGRSTVTSVSGQEGADL